MWGIIPAAGAGTRIQPLAFSKELLPVGSRFDGPIERPRAVSEHIVERMIAAGATKLCFIISPGKSDILEYYADQIGGARICYLVQRQPAGLCDAIFQAVHFVGPDEPVMVGLPDTLWFPVDGLRDLADDELSFLLFPVERPELFDAVVTDSDGQVVEIRVKQATVDTSWVWGAFKMPGAILHELHDLWCRRDPPDEYIGTLVNAFIALGGRARGIKAGQSYVDVGTFNGYREANVLLEQRRDIAAAALVPAPAKLVPRI
ncbi:MAG: sugar phosphate nucleotidyltransferase [Vicinamibacterales bacterium]